MLKIATLKEVKPFEKRVALTPQVIKTLVAAGFSCSIESDAGLQAGFLNDTYIAAGGSIINDRTQLIKDSDVILAVQSPSVDDIKNLKVGASLISLIYAHNNPELLEAFTNAKINVYALDAVPRISKAQKMDVLSSQANLGGYKAVLLGANHLGKIFPLMMTAAGTIPPAKILIFGAGVAGLQAVATAKRLGAIVEVSDVRPETKEQVESLGGKFLMVKSESTITTEGGYAKEVSAEYLQKQKELVAKHVADADIIITTALVFGKKAPILITSEMVSTMKQGAVIVDMAVEQGGNCELSEYAKTVVKNGVTIIGEANLPSLLATNASELFAKNISSLLLHLATKDGFKNELEEEITIGCMIAREGEIVHKNTLNLLKK